MAQVIIRDTESVIRETALTLKAELDQQAIGWQQLPELEFV